MERGLPADLARIDELDGKGLTREQFVAIRGTEVHSGLRWQEHLDSLGYSRL